jgi:hypothetical protein
MSQPHTITSLPEAPEAERKSRMVKYSIAMGVRLVCIGLCFVTPGWWLILPATGAIFLPYFAVMVANQVVKTPSSAQGYTPGVVVRANPPQ